MVKKSNPPDLTGEVVLVSKSAAPPVKPVKIVPPPPPPPTEQLISATKYEREVRPKKELSEKQRANLDKLIEANKKRALERRAVVTDATPQSIPEDKVLLRIKPKRAYNRKPKEEPKNEIIMPETETETETETDYEPEPVRRKPTKPKPMKAKPKPKPVKPVKKYRYDTETTSQDESSDSDSDDDKVQKYGAKVERRLEAVRSIDERLQQIKNPYAGKLSIF